MRKYTASARWIAVGGDDQSVDWRGQEERGTHTGRYTEEHDEDDTYIPVWDIAIEVLLAGIRNGGIYAREARSAREAHEASQGTYLGCS